MDGKPGYYEIRFFITGSHAYKEHWQQRSEHTLKLKKEVDNCQEKHNVARVKHDYSRACPRNPVPLVLSFLTREFNKGVLEITGKVHVVDRGAGCSLEVPCIYCLYGLKKYTERLKECPPAPESCRKPERTE